MDESFRNKLKRGDKQSWALFFRSNIDSLYEYGLDLTDDEVLLKKCINESFLYLYDQRVLLDEIKLLEVFEKKVVNLLR